MKKKTIIYFILAAVLLCAVVFLLQKSKETVMNDTYVNGNTAGNLYNGGYFCEWNGTIFFSNPNDSGKLYSMDSNGGNLKKIVDDVPTYINVDEDYIYYARSNSSDNLDFSFGTVNQNALVRIDHKGNKVLVLDDEPSIYAALLGNYIYYIHYEQEEASTLYKVRIDGEEREKVMSDPVFTCSTDGQYFYYNGMYTDGDIHKYDTATNSTSVVYEGNCYKPIVTENDVYYIDGDNNYALVHTNLTYGNPTYVTTDSVDAYNVYGSYIYYQRYDKDGSALCMIKNDGTDFRVIEEGDFCDIHVTSHYIFFREYHSGSMYYALRSDPTNIHLFLPEIEN